MKTMYGLSSLTNHEASAAALNNHMSLLPLITDQRSILKAFGQLRYISRARLPPASSICQCSTSASLLDLPMLDFDCFATRSYDRRNETGRGIEFKREGFDQGNWGTQIDELAQHEFSCFLSLSSSLALC